MSLSINGLLSSTYGVYNNQLYRGIDKNKDQQYSKAEVNNFAKSYEKSTGTAIDVDSLFEAYDVDLSGSFSQSEYEKVMADDAMNMGALYGKLPESESEASAETEQASTSNDVSSWLNKLSQPQKNSLVRSTFKAETTGNLLNAMFGGANLMSGLLSGSRNYNNYAISQYTNMMKLGAMRSTSSFSLLF